MTLRDRTIIITGATSGIGAATALACADEGMHIVLGGRRPDRLDAMKADVEVRGVRAATVAGDVLDEDNVPRLIEAAEALGGLDVVFSNAGYGADIPTLHMTDEDVRRMFDVNFFRSLDLVRAAANQLIDDGRPGHLLMCSSCLAKFTLVGYAVYSASKAAQNHVCRSLRHELRPHRIEVASVHPITTRTEFFQVSQETAGKPRPESLVPEHTPGLFVQPPERVAKAIVACLRKPRAEVWTSTIVRMTSAMMTAFPSFGDRVMRKSAEADGKH